MKEYGTVVTLPREGNSPKLSYFGKEGICQRSNQEVKGNSERVGEPQLGWESCSQVNKSLDTPQSFMKWWQEESFLIKCHMNSHLEFAQRHVEKGSLV